jgi:hypothetical protein
MPRQTDRELYVYALSSPGLPRRLTVLGRRLNCISLGDVDAIVAGSIPPGRTLDDIQLQHRIVSQLSARTSALLPARFGSTVSAAALSTLVSERHGDIHAALRLVRHCQQMTVRVFGRSTSEITPEAASSGTAYLVTRQKRANYVPPEVEVIRRELSPLVRDERVAQGERGLRAVVYHLVSRRAVAKYQRRAATLTSLLAPHAVTVTGPWPAFAFVPELF